MTDNANPRYRFGNLLARARRSWIEQVRDRMQEAGFPGYRRSDAGVLALLLQQPLAIGQLGEALRISRQAARQMADGLAERGYATFGTDEADARRTLVVLTPRGKAYGRAIWMAQDALNETVRSRVSEADLAAADAVLRAVFPDEDARQRVDKRMPPLSKSPLSGRHGLTPVRDGVACGQGLAAWKPRQPRHSRFSLMISLGGRLVPCKCDTLSERAVRVSHSSILGWATDKRCGGDAERVTAGRCRRGDGRLRGFHDRNYAAGTRCCLAGIRTRSSGPVRVGR